MHFLSNVRLDGFTVFGFWMPLIFWSCFLLFSAKNVWKDAFINSIAAVLLTFFVFREGMVGLSDISSVSFIPVYFLFIQRKNDYWHIAVVTYISSLASDVIGSPVMGDLHAGWLPYLLCTQGYTMQISFYQDIGGAGLLDGLVIDPVNAAMMVFMLRLLWVYLKQYAEEKHWFSLELDTTKEI